MNINGNQRKVYLLALAILVAAVALASTWSLWRPASDVASTPTPTATATETAPEATPVETPFAATSESPAVSPEATGTPKAQDTVSTVVYYQDNYGYLVPVMCKVPMEEGIAKATLSMMVKGADNDMQAARLGLRTVLPENMSIDLDISGGVARIDLGKEALSLANAAEETNMVNAVVQTLTEFDTVKKVEFLIGGQKMEKLPHGTSVTGQFARSAVNLESVAASATMKDARTVTLYFPGDSQTVVVPITRVVYQEPDINTAVLELTKGPSKDSALEEVIPSGCGLIDVEVQDGVAKLNFTEDFVNIVNSSDGGRLALKALTLTCTQFEGVDSVEIYVDGKPYDPGEGALAVPSFMNIADNIVYDYIQTQSALIFDME